MNSKKAIKLVGKKIPFAKQYAHHRALSTVVQSQKDEITGLRETVERLESRNEEWAREVRSLRGEDKPQTIIWPVTPEDIVAADWRSKKSKDRVVRKKTKPPLTISWVIPPMGQGSGGHADIFRTINFLESKGHHCRVYFYDALKHSSYEDLRHNLTHYSPIKAEIFYNSSEIADCDAIFATNWYTAYPVYNFKGTAKKYYYVQDFEPYFDAVGSYSTFAENTYKFGFRGITLGKWLAEKLSNEYGMECDSFELGTETKEYFLKNSKPRKKILFYARPVTPRRGFELGILTLELFHKEHPEYEINFLGWDTSKYVISFPYVNHGILSVDKLNDLYNDCSAGLVLSFTNMSLLPLEMLASGCIPVMNDAYHTRKVSYTKFLTYSEPSPTALSEALYKAASAPDQKDISRRAAEYAQQFQWNESNTLIEKLLLKELT